MTSQWPILGCDHSRPPSFPRAGEGRSSSGVRLEAVDGVPPLLGRWLADGVLIPDQAGLIHRLLGRDGVEPIDLHEVLRLLGIVGVALVAGRVFQNLEARPLSFRHFRIEFVDVRHRRGDDPDADVAGLRLLIQTRSPEESGLRVCQYQPPSPALMKPYSLASSNEREVGEGAFARFGNVPFNVSDELGHQVVAGDAVRGPSRRRCAEARVAVLLRGRPGRDGDVI